MHHVLDQKTRNPRRAHVPLPLILALGMTVMFLAGAEAGATLIPVTSVEGFPNGRTLNELPPNAIDGDSTTFTWTTDPGNIETPSHLAISFSSTFVNRLRLWKERYGGGGQNVKNLTIQYTTDGNDIPLSSRSWITVTGLVNGFEGTELLQADSVNADGTVWGDIHDSPSGDGWASVTFDDVMATGLRISFSNPNPTYPYCDGLVVNEACNHYHVGELQAYSGTAGAVPEVSPGQLAGLAMSAYPNPARSTVELVINVSRGAVHTLRITDVSGRLIRTLQLGAPTTGPNRLRWDGRDDAGRRVRPGLYFATARSQYGQVARGILIVN